MATRTLNELTPAEESTLKLAEAQENTRSTIALVFILAYMGIVTILIFLATFFGLTSDIVKDFLLAIGSPLGFIIGYYFKSKD